MQGGHRRRPTRRPRQRPQIYLTPGLTPRWSIGHPVSLRRRSAHPDGIRAKGIPFHRRSVLWRLLLASKSHLGWARTEFPSRLESGHRSCRCSGSRPGHRGRDSRRVRSWSWLPNCPGFHPIEWQGPDRILALVSPGAEAPRCRNWTLRERILPLLPASDFWRPLDRLEGFRGMTGDCPRSSSHSGLMQIDRPEHARTHPNRDQAVRRRVDLGAFRCLYLPGGLRGPSTHLDRPTTPRRRSAEPHSPKPIRA